MAGPIGLNKIKNLSKKQNPTAKNGIKNVSTIGTVMSGDTGTISPQNAKNVGSIGEPPIVGGNPNADPKIVGALSGGLNETYNPSTRQNDLDLLYSNLKKSGIAGNELAREQAIAEQQNLYGSVNNRYADVTDQLNLQQENLTPQYQGLRNESFLNTLKGLRNTDEIMSNRGMATGGANVQAQLQERVAGENKFNAINLQEQQALRAIDAERNSALRSKTDDLNKIDRAIALLKVQGAKQDSALVQSLEAKKVQSTMDLKQLQFENQQVINQNKINSGKALADYTNSLQDRQLREQELKNKQYEYGKNLALDERKVGFDEAVTEADLTGEYKGVETLKGKMTKEQIETADLQQVGLDIGNELDKVNLANLPELQGLEIDKLKTAIAGDNLINDINAVKLENLPEEYRMQVENMKSVIEQRTFNMEQAIKEFDFSKDKWDDQMEFQEAQQVIDHLLDNKRISVSQANSAIARAGLNWEMNPDNPDNQLTKARIDEIGKEKADLDKYDSTYKDESAKISKMLDNNYLVDEYQAKETDIAGLKFTQKKTGRRQIKEADKGKALNDLYKELVKHDVSGNDAGFDAVYDKAKEVGFTEEQLFQNTLKPKNQDKGGGGN